MDEQRRLDFLAAFGEEFCEGLSPVVGWGNVSPQDAFEVFLRALRREPGPQMLSSLSAPQLEQFRVASEQYFQCEGLTTEQMREIIARTLARHPPDTG